MRPHGRFAPEMEPILELRDVSKHFPTHKAVTGVTLNVARGELFALLGEKLSAEDADLVAPGSICAMSLRPSIDPLADAHIGGNCL